MSYCRVCGDIENIKYRCRSRMILCDSCHEYTPEKCTRAEFSAATGISQSDPCFQNFWEDYKYSTYGDPKEYWQAC